MSDEMRVEGAQAKQAREAKESLLKLVDSLTANHQVIVIAKDMTGATPFHVHCAGPLGDVELLSGICMTAIHTIQSKNVNKEKSN